MERIIKSIFIVVCTTIWIIAALTVKICQHIEKILLTFIIPWKTIKMYAVNAIKLYKDELKKRTL